MIDGSDLSSQGQSRDVSVLPAEDVLSVFTESPAIHNEPANIKHLETAVSAFKADGRYEQDAHYNESHFCLNNAKQH